MIGFLAVNLSLAGCAGGAVQLSYSGATLPGMTSWNPSGVPVAAIPMKNQLVARL